MALVVGGCCGNVDCAPNGFFVRYIDADSVNLLTKPDQPFYYKNLNLIYNEVPHEVDLEGGVIAIGMSEIDEIIISSEVQNDTLSYTNLYFTESGCCKGMISGVAVSHKGAEICDPCRGEIINILID